MGFNYTVTQHGSTAELHIDTGDAQEDQRIFESLYAHKQEIEAKVERPISWEPLEGKRACRIAIRMSSGGYRDDDDRSQIQDEMVDAMIGLEAALRAHLTHL